MDKILSSSDTSATSKTPCFSGFVGEFLAVRDSRELLEIIVLFSGSFLGLGLLLPGLTGQSTFRWLPPGEEVGATFFGIFIDCCFRS